MMARSSIEYSNDIHMNNGESIPNSVQNGDRYNEKNFARKNRKQSENMGNFKYSLDSPQDIRAVNCSNTESMANYDRYNDD